MNCSKVWVPAWTKGAPSSVMKALRPGHRLATVISIALEDRATATGNMYKNGEVWKCGCYIVLDIVVQSIAISVSVCLSVCLFVCCFLFVCMSLCSLVYLESSTDRQTTDRQTDGSAIAYSERNVVHVR